ncbi:hypothetical protein SUGI_0999990 [Cryptomeria japonica]|nr:hypothetical protein SUGI_0999990 [Cryptomeria japonica]
MMDRLEEPNVDAEKPTGEHNDWIETIDYLIENEVGFFQNKELILRKSHKVTEDKRYSKVSWHKSKDLDSGIVKENPKSMGGGHYHSFSYLDEFEGMLLASKTLGYNLRSVVARSDYLKAKLNGPLGKDGRNKVLVNIGCLDFENGRVEVVDSNDEAERDGIQQWLLTLSRLYPGSWKEAHIGRATIATFFPAVKRHGAAAKNRHGCHSPPVQQVTCKLA